MLLLEDNKSLVGVLTHLACMSPAMMSELRKLFLLTDEHDISITTRYIRILSNVWADHRLGREIGNSDWRLATRIFRYYDKRWGPHSIDRFASFAIKQLPGYNAKWRNGKTEAMDSIHLSD